MSRVRIPSSPPRYHAPVVKRRSCRITDPAVGVRVPPGALHARLAQWESARFTPARRTGSIPSPSTVAVAQPGRAPGCDPGGCAFEPRRSPQCQGRAIGSAASCKAVGRPATGGSSPSPGTHVPVAQQESAAVSGTAGRPFESGRGYRGARLAGAGPNPQVLMLWTRPAARAAADVIAHGVIEIGSHHLLLPYESLV